MKKMMLAALVVVLLATVASAQETAAADVAVGNSVLVVVKGFFLTADGARGSVAFNLNNWFGVAGDFGVYRVISGSDSGLTAETYTFGPRFSYRKWSRLTPFAQVLLGGGHVSSVVSGFTGATNSFAFGAGGGADIGLGSSSRIALRPQVEYFGFRANGATTGTVRVTVGIVSRIGKKS